MKVTIVAARLRRLQYFLRLQQGEVGRHHRRFASLPHLGALADAQTSLSVATLAMRWSGRVTLSRKCSSTEQFSAP